MPIRILSHDDVHRCLSPKACVDAMEQALSALARGESSFPLRSVFRPEGSPGFLGLMPGYRGGEQPLYALKAVCIFPENPARHGIDAHQGGVLLYDGETGELTAVVDGAALTVDPHRRRDGGRHAGPRAPGLERPRRARRRLAGACAHRRAGRHARARARAGHEPHLRARAGARRRAVAEAIPSRSRRSSSVGEAVRGADVVVTVSNAREPILDAGQLEPGMHVNLVGSSVASTREITGAGLARTSLFVDRRESTVNESGDYLMALREGAIDENHIRAEVGEVLEGMCAGTHEPGRDHLLQVARHRGRGPGGRGARDRERRGGRHRNGGPLVIPLADIYAAREALAGTAVRTPLVRLHVDAPAEIYLKLENLQPIGSFKIRGAFNAMSRRSPEELAAGVITASAGNMAQGVAWGAKLRGIPCTVVVPDYAPRTKIEAIERLGGTVIPVPFADWWQAIVTSSFPGLDGVFIHPVLDDAVMAGNGTIGLELLEDLPELDAVVVPWGGGGLTCGIASALRAAQARREGSTRSSPRPARRWRGRSRRASRCRSTTTGRPSSTARAARRSCRRCGSSAAA